MPDLLVTPRLALRAIAPDDLPWLTALWADPVVTRFLDGTKTPAEVRDWYKERVLPYYEANEGLGVWLTVERDTRRPVGFHLLNFIRGESLVQVGFTLAAPFWRKGYAAEMARAVLRYGFADLGIPDINGIASVENVASQRVLAAIGLTLIGECTFPAYSGRLARFRGEREAWLRAHDDASSKPLL